MIPSPLLFTDLPLLASVCVRVCVCVDTPCVYVSAVPHIAAFAGTADEAGQQVVHNHTAQPHSSSWGLVTGWRTAVHVGLDTAVCGTQAGCARLCSTLVRYSWQGGLMLIPGSWIHTGSTDALTARQLTLHTVTSSLPPRRAYARACVLLHHAAANMCMSNDRHAGAALPPSPHKALLSHQGPSLHQVCLLFVLSKALLPACLLLWFAHPCLLNQPCIMLSPKKLCCVSHTTTTACTPTRVLIRRNVCADM